MSQAPDFSTLYDFEGSIETAVCTVLDSFGLRTLTQESDENQSTPFISVSFSTGEGDRSSPYMVAGNEPRPRRYMGVLTTTIYTTRKENGEVAVSYRKRLRALLYGFRRSFTEAVLPYHVVTQMWETGTTRSINVDSEPMDVTTITWGVEFYIRPNAWPAAVEEIL